MPFARTLLCATLLLYSPYHQRSPTPCAGTLLPLSLAIWYKLRRRFGSPFAGALRLASELLCASPAPSFLYSCSLLRTKPKLLSVLGRRPPWLLESTLLFAAWAISFALRQRNTELRDGVARRRVPLSRNGELGCNAGKSAGVAWRRVPR